MFDIDDIVTLDNGEEYYLIEKFILEDGTYFYAVKNNDNLEDLIEGEYCFFKVDGDYLELVVDSMKNKILTNLYIDKVKDN